jgi:hypothetical protein
MKILYTPGPSPLAKTPMNTTDTGNQPRLSRKRFELWNYKKTSNQEGREETYSQKIKESKILRCKLRSARKNAMTMCIRVSEKIECLVVPFLGRCVHWMILPLDDVLLTDVSRPWASYMQRVITTAYR